MTEREQKKKVIEGTVYLVTQMDAVSALKVQAKLIKITGEGIFSLIGKEGKTVKEKLAALIPKIMENFDDETVVDLVLSLYKSNVFIEKNSTQKVLDFESYFIVKPMLMWKVTGFILETNFAMGKSKESDLPTIKEDKLTQEN